METGFQRCIHFRHLRMRYDGWMVALQRLKTLLNSLKINTKAVLSYSGDMTISTGHQKNGALCNRGLPMKQVGMYVLSEYKFRVKHPLFWLASECLWHFVWDSLLLSMIVKDAAGACTHFIPNSHWCQWKHLSLYYIWAIHWLNIAKAIYGQWCSG